MSIAAPDQARIPYPQAPYLADLNAEINSAVQDLFDRTFPDQSGRSRTAWRAFTLDQTDLGCPRLRILASHDPDGPAYRTITLNPDGFNTTLDHQAQPTDFPLQPSIETITDDFIEWATQHIAQYLAARFDPRLVITHFSSLRPSIVSQIMHSAGARIQHCAINGRARKQSFANLPKRLSALLIEHFTDAKTLNVLQTTYYHRFRTPVGSHSGTTRIHNHGRRNGDFLKNLRTTESWATDTYIAIAANDPRHLDDHIETAAQVDRIIQTRLGVTDEQYHYRHSLPSPTCQLPYVVTAKGPYDANFSAQTLSTDLRTDSSALKVLHLLTSPPETTREAGEYPNFKRIFSPETQLHPHEITIRDSLTRLADHLRTRVPHKAQTRILNEYFDWAQYHRASEQNYDPFLFLEAPSSRRDPQITQAIRS